MRIALLAGWILLSSCVAAAKPVIDPIRSTNVRCVQFSYPKRYQQYASKCEKFGKVIWEDRKEKTVLVKVKCKAGWDYNFLLSKRNVSKECFK